MNTIQGNSNIETYYTKLKTIWQDLLDYRPLITCSCDGLKAFLDHLDYEYVMIFLMGLNETYSSTKAQILLMKPLPNITEAFSLLIQEERQRTAVQSVSKLVESLTLMANSSKRFDRPPSPTNNNYRRKDQQRPLVLIVVCKVMLLAVVINLTAILRGVGIVSILLHLNPNQQLMLLQSLPHQILINQLLQEIFLKVY